MEIDEQLKCRGIHKVNNIIPTVESLGKEESICDCGKIIFYAEMCDCPIRKVLIVKSKENTCHVI